MENQTGRSQAEYDQQRAIEAGQHILALLNRAIPQAPREGQNLRLERPPSVESEMARRLSHRPGNMYSRVRRVSPVICIRRSLSCRGLQQVLIQLPQVPRGQTERSEAAIQPVPAGPLITSGVSEITAMCVGLIGLIGATATTGLPMWKVTVSIGENKTEMETRWEGVWMNCFREANIRMQYQDKHG
ncbi:uncharacterized protein LOC124884330 isoform X2 [Girardinichthys multiradiatus]|uniref:uncharacterized protein LOC124884330 isoform X2 n=1 Tax=Girardinichthys multiradiatus TaxID=208333 RepID=UPI001FAC067D|nr:uncharacterized protein LOC124884330 isoform X2 [Girardinichthys multiradiatus]